MNPDRQQALEYLRAPADGLWRWAENGAVLVWRDGTTIAFREEIIQLIEWLAPNGLPGFGALIFLLAACRGKVPAVEDILIRPAEKLPANMGKDAERLVEARKQLEQKLETALAQLHKVAALPSEVRAGLKARCVLAEAVFEAAKNERHVQAATILSGMKSPMTDAELLEAGSGGNYIRQIHVLAEGLKPHTAESLALRMRTGLDALPSALETELPSTEQARRLIEELSRDKELGCIARAARELMAALKLPRRLGEAEQLSLGGVADITNRGPLDRLLLSELAHDDLTLSVRVALNEALYLRREPPVREPPGALMLLLDSGVRLWGVPRVLATSVALALIARDKQHSKINAWRAHKKELPVVDLLTRNGLTQHLGTLETEAHPGGALPAFAEITTTDAHNQAVLITHRDTLADPEFRRVIAGHPGAVGFIATVDGEGHFELHSLPLAHRPPLCAADINLESIFGEKTVVPLSKVPVDASTPAIFGLQPFPFLLPLAEIDHWITVEDQTYAVLNERRLVQFHNTAQGGRTLATDLPNGKTLWMGMVDGTLHIVKAGASQRPARLLSLPLPEGELRVNDLVTGADIWAVHAYGDVIVVIRALDVRAYSAGDGRLLHKMVNPHPWKHGRYFKGREHFYFVAWDGAVLKFEPVTLPKTFDFDKVVSVFDRSGIEGPWVLTNMLEFHSTATSEKIRTGGAEGFPANAYLTTISRDGHRLRIDVSGKQLKSLHNLVTGECTYPKGEVRLDEPPCMPSRNLFHVLEAFVRLDDGIALRGRKNRWWKIAVDARSRKLRIDVASAEDIVEIAAAAKQPFNHTLKVQGQELQVAEWPCGNKAFLDWRGLLHLKSYDPQEPEISLVLADGEVAGWTSDGHVCGPAFFFEGEPVSEPHALLQRIQTFLRQL